MLEEEYGFIRTHIFWVRDQEPIGLATVPQAGHELKRLVKGLLKLAEEAGDRRSWGGHLSSEFLTAAVAAVILPLGLFRIRRMLRRRITRALPPSHLHGDHARIVRVDMSPAIKPGLSERRRSGRERRAATFGKGGEEPGARREGRDVRRAFRSLVLGLAWASIWPGYLVLVAQAARLGPWPRNLGILASTVLHGLALGLFVPGVLSWMTRRDGWAERFLGIPAAVGRELCRTGRFLSAAAVICLVPAYLLTYGEIAPEGRPITAAGLLPVLHPGFRDDGLGLLVLLCCAEAPPSWAGATCTRAHRPTPSSPPSNRSRARERRARHRHGDRDRDLRIPCPGWPGSAGGGESCHGFFLAITAGIVVLDVRGYRFTARRLAVGGTETLAVFLLCWALNRAANRMIAQHARRWVRPGRFWARASTTAVALRSVSRNQRRGGDQQSSDAIGSRATRPARLKTWRAALPALVVRRSSCSPLWALPGSGSSTWR